MKRARAKPLMHPEARRPTYRLARQVGEALKVHGLMLVTAESCTGGGIAQAITAVPGSSGWFDRGFVTYSNAAKQEMLGVLSVTLERYGAVSEQTVREMAEGALRRSHAGVALAVSGIAGPTGGTPDKPVGTVWFAWAGRNTLRTERHQLAGGREAIRMQAVCIALRGVLGLLKGVAGGV